MIKHFASRSEIAVLMPKIEKCAQQDKMLQLLDRLEVMIKKTEQKLNADYPTRDMVDRKLD